ncbi:RNase A-like domain-containing protein [Thermovibrio sp.]
MFSLKKFLALFLLPLFLLTGCFSSHREVNPKVEKEVLKELGYRGLTFYEQVGGHTIKRHVGKKYQWLVHRLKEEPRLRAASSFYNLQSAERAVERAIYFNRDKILRWLKNPHSPNKLVITYTFNHPIGIKVERAGKNAFTESTSRTVRVILKKDKRFGFIVLTAYPS